MMKPRFQFNLKGMMLVVALLAGLMLIIKPSAKTDTFRVDFFGDVQFRHDGSMEVQEGAVRIYQDNKQTAIRADRIVVQKDGTAEVYGHGTIRQTTR